MFVLYFLCSCRPVNNYRLRFLTVPPTGYGIMVEHLRHHGCYQQNTDTGESCDPQMMSTGWSDEGEGCSTTIPKAWNLHGIFVPSVTLGSIERGELENPTTRVPIITVPICGEGKDRPHNRDHSRRCDSIPSGYPVSIMVHYAGAIAFRPVFVFVVYPCANQRKNKVCHLLCFE